MQASWMIKTAKLLRDPLMMRWAIVFYRNCSNYGQNKDWILDHWFTESLIRYWIKRDDFAIIADMLGTLPATHFTPFVSVLAARWAHFPDTVVKSSTRVLAHLDPQLAAQTFTDYLADITPRSADNILGVLLNLNQLPVEHARSLLESLLPYAEDECNRLPFAPEFAFMAAARAMPEILPRLFCQLLLLERSERSERADRAEQTEQINPLQSIGEGLFGDADLLWFCFAQIFETDDSTPMVEMAAFFDADAPLLEIDRVMALTASAGKLSAAMQMLQAHRPRAKICELVWEVLASNKITETVIRAPHVSAIAVAAVVQAYRRKDLVTEGLNAEQLIDLIIDDFDYDPHFDQMVACLRGLPREDVVDRLLQAIKGADARKGNGRVSSIVKLLLLVCELRWEEFIPAMIDFLHKDFSESQRAMAKKALIRIGKPASDALIRQWDDLNVSQKRNAIAPILYSGNDDIAEFVLQRFDELAELSSEMTAELTTVAADLRVLQRLERELRHRQAHLDLAYYRLSRLVDFTGPEFNQVRKRVRAGMGQSIAKLPVDFPHMQLPLKCLLCDETNYYQVKGLAVGLDPARPSEDPMVLADEFPCVACGAWPEFEIGTGARLAIAERVRRATDADDKEDIAMVTSVFNIEGGGLLPFALIQMQQNLRDDPQDWRSLLELGRILEVFQRPRQALASLSKAYELMPTSLAVVSCLASHLYLIKEEAKAFDILARCVAEKANWKNLSAQDINMAERIALLFNRLRIELGHNTLPALPLSEAMHTEKTGRNDPCPCGSGKKFKKCCGK